MSVKIDIDSARPLPGAPLRGHVSWQLEAPPAAAELRLRWTLAHDHDDLANQSETVTKIDVATLPADPTGAPYRSLPGGEVDLRERDQRRFELLLPESPYSFAGDLASLTWELELELTPGAHTVAIPLTLSPTGEVVDIADPEASNEATSTAKVPS